MRASPATIGPVTDAAAYLAAAKSLSIGVHALAGNMEAASARAFLAAQTLECILKAFLSHSGVSEAKLKNQRIRHNLEALWKQAVDHGAPIQAQPLAWCVRLNQLHDKPYYLRYPMGLHGLVLPGSEPMVTELESIVAAIKFIIQPG